MLDILLLVKGWTYFWLIIYSPATSGIFNFIHLSHALLSTLSTNITNSIQKTYKHELDKFN